MSEVEGERSSEADEISNGDPFVASADGEHLGGDGPGDSQRVELLHLRSTPDVGTFS